MRCLEIYVKKYGPEVGPKYYHALQSQAAHASVGARLRRKIEAMSGRGVAAGPSATVADGLPLFPESGDTAPGA